MNTANESKLATKQNLAYWLRQEASRVERDSYGELAQKVADDRLGVDAKDWIKSWGPVSNSHPLHQIAQGKFHVQSLHTESDSAISPNGSVASHRVLTLCLEYRQLELSFYAAPAHGTGGMPVFSDWDVDSTCTEEVVTQQPELVVMVESLLSNPLEDFAVFKGTLTPQEERQLLLLATRAIARDQMAEAQENITNTRDLERQ